MSAWSHLPNAKHIDRILASVKENPAAWDAARGAVWGAALDAARGAVWGAVLALVTYDHAAKYLEMTPDQLRVWAELSEDPAAVLLIPAVIAFELLGTMYPTDVAS